MQKQLSALEAADEYGSPGIDSAVRSSHNPGPPGPALPRSTLFDEQKNWLQRYNGIVNSDPLTVVKLHLNVSTDGHVKPFLAVKSLTQAGLECVREQVQSIHRDSGVPVSHAQASKAPHSQRIPLHSLDRAAGHGHTIGNMDNAECFHSHCEVWKQKVGSVTAVCHYG